MYFVFVILLPLYLFFPLTKFGNSVREQNKKKEDVRKSEKKWISVYRFLCKDYSIGNPIFSFRNSLILLAISIASSLSFIEISILKSGYLISTLNALSFITFSYNSLLTGIASSGKSSKYLKS
jgi:hypothetical protein